MARRQSSPPLKIVAAASLRGNSHPDRSSRRRCQAVPDKVTTAGSPVLLVQTRRWLPRRRLGHRRTAEAPGCREANGRSGQIRAPACRGDNRSGTDCGGGERGGGGRRNARGRLVPSAGRSWLPAHCAWGGRAPGGRSVASAGWCRRPFSAPGGLRFYSGHGGGDAAGKATSRLAAETLQYKPRWPTWTWCIWPPNASAAPLPLTSTWGTYR